MKRILISLICLGLMLFFIYNLFLTMYYLSCIYAISFV